MIGLKEQESLLLNLGQALKRKTTAYAIGGTAMMFLGLKQATLDIDIVFTDEKSRAEVKKAVLSLGYEPMNPVDVYGGKENSPLLFKRASDRIDLFSTDIISFAFSKGMQQRAVQSREFGNLVLKIADPHDIIVLKAATDRLKDRDDARSIIAGSRIDWGIIVQEAEEQYRLGKHKAVFETIQFFLDLRKMGIKVPEDVMERIFLLFSEASGLGKK